VNGYLTEPTVKYGAFLWNEVQNELPAVCYCDTGLELEQLQGDYGRGAITYLFYGYADWDGESNTDDIRNLALDIIHFLEVDFTYASDLFDITNIEIIPGGHDRPISTFLFDCKIKFEFKNTTINS
jgi:hypothetical protein